MDTQASKLNLIEKLILLHDENRLDKLGKLFSTFRNKLTIPDLTPMSLEGFYARNNI